MEQDLSAGEIGRLARPFSQGGDGVQRVPTKIQEPRHLRIYFLRTRRGSGSQIDSGCSAKPKLQN